MSKKNAPETAFNISPSGWRILVRDHEAKEVTDGGILLTAQSQQDTATLNYVGEVIELGPQAFIHPKFLKGEPWCKVGDFVLFGRYSGVKFQISGSDAYYRFVNDDEILGTVSDMELVKVYV